MLINMQLAGLPQSPSCSLQASIVNSNQLWNSGFSIIRWL